MVEFFRCGKVGLSGCEATNMKVFQVFNANVFAYSHAVVSTSGVIYPKRDEVSLIGEIASGGGRLFFCFHFGSFLCGFRTGTSYSVIVRCLVFR